MKTIVFIDDQPYFAKRYLEKLEERYTVKYFERVEDGIKHVQGSAPVDAVVLDMMMPPPRGMNDALQEEGLATGLWVLNQVRSRVLEQPMPVLMLTYRALDIVHAGVKELAFPRRYVDVRGKDDVRADRICLVIEQLMLTCADEHAARTKDAMK